MSTVTTGRTLDETGEPVFHVDGEDRPAAPGETVPGDELSHALTAVRSPGHLRGVSPTLGGVAHDPTIDAGSPLQLAVIARQLAGDTVFTEIDPRLTAPLTRALEPPAKLGGYRGAHATVQSAVVLVAPRRTGGAMSVAPGERRGPTTARSPPT